MKSAGPGVYNYKVEHLENDFFSTFSSPHISLNIAPKSIQGTYFSKFSVGRPFNRFPVVKPNSMKTKGKGLHRILYEFL